MPEEQTPVPPRGEHEPRGLAGETPRDPGSNPGGGTKLLSFLKFIQFILNQKI